MKNTTSLCYFPENPSALKLQSEIYVPRSWAYHKSKKNEAMEMVSLLKGVESSNAFVGTWSFLIKAQVHCLGLDNCHSNRYTCLLYRHSLINFYFTAVSGVLCEKLSKRFKRYKSFARRSKKVVNFLLLLDQNFCW